MRQPLFLATPKDYRRWPEDERWELIDGAYDMSPAPPSAAKDGR
ncbi:MAG: hypothetical protein ACREYC_12795 [Gammaproteobacteria bacterium]